ncbi:hypothetical protein WJX84_002391 [Apatococcus fuscideae]|uniref:PhoD-like phosphatase domain-containing protein n=1 Tax=Apatococcus fuscideae TaxID=2026836 RepID=A0AAW1T348_9CHLO
MSGYPPPPPSYGGGQSYPPAPPAYGAASAYQQSGIPSQHQAPPVYGQQYPASQAQPGFAHQTPVQQYGGDQQFSSSQQYSTAPYQQAQGYQEQPYQHQQSFQQQTQGYQQQQQGFGGNMLGANGQTPAGNMTQGPAPGSDLHGGSMADGALSNQMDRDTAAQVPELAAQIPNEPVAGPYLQFINYNPQQYLWRASALIGMHMSVQGSPSVTLTDRDGPRQAPSVFIATAESWNYWRFHFDVVSKSAETRCEYQVHLPNNMQTSQTSQRYHFYVPAQRQQWHWAFHSCNGLSAGSDTDRWGVPHLWKDVLNRHAAGPLHALVGGGDQIYNDAVWKTAPLLAWLDIPDHKERYEVAFSPEMEKACMKYYSEHYREHFATPVMRDVLACIPQINIWDDHDIFDGWGSYPEPLQMCHVFQGVYRVARLFYLLFQHQTTLDRREEVDLFGPPATFSFIRLLGPSVAVLGPDSRAQRTKKQVISSQAYDDIFSRLGQMPLTVKHLITVTTVPVIFPKLPASEQVFAVIDSLPVVKGAMQKTGVGKGILDRFGNADLLDDIVDHWDASSHLHERRMLIQRLQTLCLNRQLRVTFISGDVHLAAVGRLYTNPKVAHLRNDHRFMTQIVSSAVWNHPPPGTLCTLMEKSNKSSKLDGKTKEKMVKIFTDQPNKKLLDRRNWCEVSYRPAVQEKNRWGSVGKEDWGNLVFSLRVEDPDAQLRPPAVYDTIIPSYVQSGRESGSGGASAAPEPLPLGRWSNPEPRVSSTTPPAPAGPTGSGSYAYPGADAPYVNTAGQTVPTYGASPPQQVQDQLGGWPFILLLWEQSNWTHATLQLYGTFTK